MINVAAGSFEDLLSIYPNEAITLIENEIKTNLKLKSMLGDVWQNLIPDEIWERLKKIR